MQTTYEQDRKNAASSPRRKATLIPTVLISVSCNFFLNKKQARIHANIEKTAGRMAKSISSIFEKRSSSLAATTTKCSRDLSPFVNKFILACFPWREGLGFYRHCHPLAFAVIYSYVAFCNMVRTSFFAVRTLPSFLSLRARHT